MSDEADFIRAYTSADEARIRFEWNGKHSEEFVDRNMDFREMVREAVLENVTAAPLELVRDLFRAETQCSREAWGIAYGANKLAESLVRRGGDRYLDDFLEGKFQSFDASMGSVFEVDQALAMNLLNVVRQRLQSSPNSPRAELWRAGEQLFLDWIGNCR